MILRSGRADLGGLLFALALLLGLIVLASPGTPPIFPSAPGIAGTAASTGSNVGNQDAQDAYAKLPLSFVPNRGQTDQRVRYYAQTSGASFYFTKQKAVIALTKGKKGAALDLRFLGANPNARLEATKRAAGRVNYIRGNDPSRYHTNLPTYRELVYRDLWPGIDLAFRGQGGKLKYEFRLAPRANPRDIRLAYAGAESLSVDRSGALLVGTSLGTLSDARPHSHQRVGGRSVPIRSRYSVGGKTYGFELGAYDRRRPLVIDPVLVYSTHLNGVSQAIAVDQAGNAYVTGSAGSAFPTTAGAYDTTYNGNADVGVTKLSADGSSVVYSTYLGGTAGDIGRAIAVDPSGNAYVTGDTLSENFPTTPGAFDESYNGGTFYEDVFVAKLSADGSSLAYSTFVGGSRSEEGNGIAVDGTGNAFVTGYADSPDFPTTLGALGTSHDHYRMAFVTKLNASGSALAYSTYLGSAIGYGVTVDASGNAYVTGQAGIVPTTPGAFQTTPANVFISKINATGSSLVYSTYLGGSVHAPCCGGEEGAAIAVDGSGNAYVTGTTNTFDFPTTTGAFDYSLGGRQDVFAAKLNSTGSNLVYSTYLGGSIEENWGELGDIAVDNAGNAYISGTTGSSDFPVTAGALDTHVDGEDAFLTKLNPVGTGVLYSTLFGGSAGDFGRGLALDGASNAYLTGGANSTDFPSTPGVFDPTFNGGGSFVAKITIPPRELYPHPVGASPVAVAFVPAFRPCETTSADSTHGSPLDFPSCSNPTSRSSLVTLGSNSISIARIVVCPSNFSSAFCNPTAGSMPKPDVRFTGSIRDVKCAAVLPADHFGCSGPNADYDPDPSPGPYTDAGNGRAGAQPPCFPSSKLAYNACVGGADISIDAEIPGASVNGVLTPFEGNGIRITDSELGNATLVDIAFPLPLDCLPTTDPNQGSTCGVNTTANALAPGAYRHGDTGTWQIGELELKDSGLYGGWRDGDEQVFAVQGIYLP